MKYVIENDRGVLVGPFATALEAVEWALARYELPWTLRRLNIIPQQSDERGND